MPLIRTAEDNPVARRPDPPLASYLAAISAHRWVVALVALGTLAGSMAFLSLRSAEYKATTDLLVEPLPQDDETFLGLPLLRDTGDPVRTVQTAAALVESAGSAPRGATIEVNPKGESNILAVDAIASSPEESAAAANGFANSAIAARNEQLERLGGQLVRQLDARIAAIPPEDAVTRAALVARRDQVSTVASRGDPTVILSREADPPESAEGASTGLVLILALLAGLALGAGSAVLLQLVDRRFRTEEELMRFIPLPVLARVPLLSNRARRGPPDSIWYVPPEVREPYRTVVVQLEQSSRRLGVLMVTSASKGDGKTTSAINLAVSLASAGKRVIILDFDLRHPRVAAELGVTEGRRLADLIDPSQDLRRLLSRPTDLRTLSVLAIRYEAEDARLTDPAAWRMPEFIEEARGMADHVIIDTPPLGEVSDALPLTRLVDEILVVLRPGNTIRSHLRVLQELLERAGESPFGCIVVGAQERAGRGYGTYGYGPGGAPDLVLQSGTGSERVAARRAAQAE